MLMEKKITASLAFLACAMAAGCGTFKNTAQDAISVAEEHPISVDSQVVTLTLTPTNGDAALSRLDAARVRAFAETYMRKGHGPISITEPDGAAFAAAFASNVEGALYDAGVSRDAIGHSSHQGSGSAGDAVILSYTHYVATPSACGVWQNIRRRDYKNQRSPNFGCASQNNLAAMIVDPRDLIAPQVESEPDSAIRIRGVRAFRQGEDTASERNGDIQVRVDDQ
ncbi:MAG: CpaD family pilus assembly protein [Pseudomonadota bacterium]